MAISGGPRAGRWPRSLQEPRQDLVGRPDSLSHFPDIQRKSSCLEPFPAPGNSACSGPATGLQAARGEMPGKGTPRAMTIPMHSLA